MLSRVMVAILMSGVLLIDANPLQQFPSAGSAEDIAIDEPKVEDYEFANALPPSDTIVSPNELVPLPLTSPDDAHFRAIGSTRIEELEDGCAEEYSTGTGYGYYKFYKITDISERTSFGNEIKLLVRSAQDAHISFLNKDSWKEGDTLPYELVLSAAVTNQFSLHRKGKLALSKTRANLLDRNTWIPLIIRISSKVIDIRVEGERSPIWTYSDSDQPKITYVSFSSKGSVNSYWQLNCPLEVPLIKVCQTYSIAPGPDVGFTTFYSVEEIEQNRHNSNLTFNFYLKTAKDAQILLSSTARPPSLNGGSPYYEITLGADYNRAYEIYRNYEKLDAESVNGVLSDKNEVLIVITYDIYGTLRVDVGGSVSMSINDPYVVDVRYVSFRSLGMGSSEWKFDC